MNKKEKTHWKKNFNYDYMGAYSLEDGKDVIVTIKELKKEKVTGQKGKKEECFVCYFTDSPKPMILNRTNCKIIERLYDTPFVEDWKGKRIQLYVSRVEAFGDVTDALRVRDFLPKDNQDNSGAIELLNNCKTLTELKTCYQSLGKTMQSDTEVLKLKETLKNSLK